MVSDELTILDKNLLVIYPVVQLWLFLINLKRCMLIKVGIKDKMELQKTYARSFTPGKSITHGRMPGKTQS